MTGRAGGWRSRLGWIGSVMATGGYSLIAPKDTAAPSVEAKPRPDESSQPPSSSHEQVGPEL